MINKIKNNIFVKSAVLLLVGGVLTKTVGFFLKIIITRKIGTEGIGLYSLLGPSISLLTVIATFSYPTAISRAISNKTLRAKSLLYSIIPVSLILNLILFVVVFLFAKTLSIDLLKDERLYYPIICIGATLPFISISSIIKGYYWGKQNMFPYMLSNFLEQITRMILILLFLDKFISIGLVKTICFIILINAVGEVVSQIVMIQFFPKYKINVREFVVNKKDVLNVMNTALPATSSKIIGSIAYFLEPIILTNILLYVGYSKDYIIYEYGVINAYSLTLLLMPQFFTQNMSTALVPELSKYYALKDYKMCKKRIKQILIVSSTIGAISTLIISLFPSFFLNILYHTNEGIDYIRLLSPFTILFYIEYPLINALQALNKSKDAMKATIINSIVRLFSITIFSFMKIGMYSLLISIIINLVVSTYIYYRLLKKAFNP